MGKIFKCLSVENTENTEHANWLKISLFYSILGSLGPQIFPHVIRGHVMSQALFAHMTSERKEIESWAWSHCASLVETRNLKCNVTYLGHDLS